MARSSKDRGDGSRPAPWRRFAVPAIAACLVAVAGILIYRTLSNYDFDEVARSVASVPAANLALAGAFAAASYFCLTWFDWLAVRYAGHRLPYRKVALASFTALSLGHNIGFAAMSSGAVRYRFYARWGLDSEAVAKVILFCGLTVGLGLAALGGLALVVRPAVASEVIGLSPALSFAVGAACLVAVAVYLALAVMVRGSLSIGSWTMEMPRPGLALTQVAIGALNFACVAASLHQAVAGLADVAYLSVATVYVVANVATLVSHVPGGLGVIEAVVTYLLPQAGMIGAVLLFRFVYFLVPLALGGALFGVSELAMRTRAREGNAAEA
ncbi:MAG: lysylphosphatidylglycerol synthase domain-containing protein [Rhodospirillaceae bacterium]